MPFDRVSQRKVPPSACFIAMGWMSEVQRGPVAPSLSKPAAGTNLNLLSYFCSTSDYSNISAVTPTSVLPSMFHGNRNNHVWSHSHYVKVRNLRDGSSGSVHLAVDLRNGSQVAIKFIPRGSSRCVADIFTSTVRSQLTSLVCSFSICTHGLMPLLDKNWLFPF